jgi:hypothetical protein
MRKILAPRTIELSVDIDPLGQGASSGWEGEVCSAAARLNEGWVLPETRCNPAIAEELAAFLCAYAA